MHEGGAVEGVHCDFGFDFDSRGFEVGMDFSGGREGKVEVSVKVCSDFKVAGVQMNLRDFSVRNERVG